jgi:hypothetical protein
MMSAWYCFSSQSCIVVSTHLEQGYQVCTSREYIGNHNSIWFYLRSLHLPEEIQTIEVSSLRGIEYAHDIELHDIKSSLGIWLYIFNTFSSLRPNSLVLHTWWRIVFSTMQVLILHAKEHLLSWLHLPTSTIVIIQSVSQVHIHLTKNNILHT